jgi:hypothetical protein
VSLELSFSLTGQRLIAPGVTHFLHRAGSDSVAGAVCSAAAVAAGEALDVTCGSPLLDDEGVDQNPFTRRRSELTPTSMLRAIRTTSAHYLVVLFENVEDRSFLAGLMTLPIDEMVARMFLIHAEVFELGRESRHAIAEYWSRAGDPLRYSLGIWGLVTAATFGVRHLHEGAAAAFRTRLDDCLPDFSRRLAAHLRTLVERPKSAQPSRLA